MTKKKQNKHSCFVFDLHIRNWVERRWFAVQVIIFSSSLCVLVVLRHFWVPSIFLTDLCGSDLDRGTEVNSLTLHMTTSHWWPLRPRIFVSTLLIGDCVSQLLVASCTPDMAFPVNSSHGLLFSSLRLTLWLNRNKKCSQTNLRSPEPAHQKGSDKWSCRDKGGVLKYTQWKVSSLSKAGVTTEGMSSLFVILGFSEWELTANP